MGEEALNGIQQSIDKALFNVEDDVHEQLQPTLDMVNQVHSEVVHWLNVEGFEEEQIQKYLYPKDNNPMSVSERLGWPGRDLHAFSLQYEHIRQVCAATVALKRQLYELGMPDRIIAYQTGTGWPLPEESESLQKIDSIRYGTGPLAEHKPRRASQDPLAGMHIYLATSQSGETFTVLVDYKRDYSYTETNWEYGPYDLAFMPELLKGAGVEFVLSTYASGLDTAINKKGKAQKGDIGVVLTSGDESHHANFMAAMTGDQRIRGHIFGGAFQGIASMQPDARDVAMLLEVVDDLHEQNTFGLRVPEVFPTVQTDTFGKPNYQNIYTHAAPHATFKNIVNMKHFPPEVMRLFKGKPITLAHGMGQQVERLNNFESNPDELQTDYNRPLRDLAVEFFSDPVKTSVGGESHSMTDKKVAGAGEEVKPLMARLAANLLLRYTDLNS